MTKGHTYHRILNSVNKGGMKLSEQDNKWVIRPGGKSGIGYRNKVFLFGLERRSSLATLLGL